MSFAEDFAKDKKEKEENAKSGDWYKLKDGDNKFRIISEPVKFFEMYDQQLKYLQLWHDCGLKGSLKYLSWCWLYSKKEDGSDDNKLVLIKLPYSVMEQIYGYMTNEEYGFSDFPMPYDITVKVSNAGTTDVSYMVQPARQNSEIAPEILAEVGKQTNIADILEKMKEKSKKKYEESQGKVATRAELPVIEYPDADALDINPEDIPF